MITLSNIFIKYGERILLDSISLAISEKERIGLVGRNGAGKSTLLKVIAREQTPDEGTIAIPNDRTLGYLHQEMDLPKGRTVMNETLQAFSEVLKIEKRLEEINLELGERTDYESDSYSNLLVELSESTERFRILGGDTMTADTERVLQGLGFKSTDMDRLTDEFSGGWQMRIELAKMLLSRPDYLLLDEPTNHLDIESIIWLEQFLTTYEGSVIIISHDKTFLDNVTKRTVEIEAGEIFDYKAAYTKYITLRAERREKLESAFRNQQKVIAQKEKTINRFMAKANKTKMAQSMKKQLDKMERIELDEGSNAAMRIRFLPAPRSGEVALEANRVSKRYDKLLVLDDVDFKLLRGEKIAFVGQNGQGKTTLSKILVGKESASEGNTAKGHNIEVGYYAQNQSESLHHQNTVLQAIEKVSPPDMRTKLRGILGAFMFSGADVEKKVSVLSGGERARLALACLLLRPVNLLILDEPTNHLDMLSKEVLKQALQQYDGTMIVVSHDRDFLEGLTDRTLEFRDRKLYNHIGDIKAFLEKRKVEDMRMIELRSKKNKLKKSDPKKLSHEERKQREKDYKQLQRTLFNSERLVEKTEKKIVEIQIKMGQDGFYQSENAQETIDKYNQLNLDLEGAMEAWEKAQKVIDGFKME